MPLVRINRSPDLKRLREDGYEVEIFNGYLLVSHVPYVNSKSQVAYGTLVSSLDLAGDTTAKPKDHVAMWAGEFPCSSNGSKLEKLVNDPNKNEKIREGLVVTMSFSHKPEGGYNDYHQKMTQYIAILENEAHAIDPKATSRTFPLVPLSEEESVFCYMDNSASRAGIVSVNDKLDRGHIAIVGLGGTGAYVLDLVAKTTVKEVHLYDGDTFLQHNAFRSPGAPSLDDLKKPTTKVQWFAVIYSRMRRKIVPHPQYVDESNIAELKQMDFVFLCIEGSRKKIIVEYLIQNKIPFVDVGIEMYNANDTLGGMARVTTVTPDYHDHLSHTISFSDREDDVYSQNIQIAEMNALNATLAVIKWKKLWGFYLDEEHEHNTLYGIITNLLTNEDIPNEEKENQT